MATRQEVPINHNMLQWARRQADFNPNQVVARARIKGLKTRGLTAEERLAIWESGQEKPTLNELELLARAYRRPLLTFFLSEPPRVETGLQDFRTIGDRPVEGSSPEFAALRRQIEALQKEVRALVEDEGGGPLEFIGSASMDMTPTDIVQAIRDRFEYPFRDQQRVRSSEQLFNILRDRAGEAGVFVLRKADLGSHHSKVFVEEFRGLVISDPIAPFIVVNPNDAKVALVFTIVHELAHLWLGESGISNFNVFGRGQSNHQEIEVFCNRVAAEFLVPESRFLNEWNMVMDGGLDVAIQSLSRNFKVSRVVIARRLLDLERITGEGYWELYNRWRDELYITREYQRQKESGPGYFVNTKSRLGSKLLNTVIGAAYDGRLSYRDASKLLGIKVDYFGKFYEG